MAEATVDSTIKALFVNNMFGPEPMQTDPQFRNVDGTVNETKYQCLDAPLQQRVLVGEGLRVSR